MQFEQVKENFRSQIPAFAEKARAFAAGEVDRKSYKGFPAALAATPSAARRATCCACALRAAA